MPVIQEFRIPVSSDLDPETINAGDTVTQMSFKPLQTSIKEDGKPIMKRIMHSEVYGKRPILNLQPGEEVSVTHEYIIMDSMPYQAKQIPNIGQQSYLPDPQMIGVLFKETHTDIYSGDSMVASAEDRFPEDSLYATPTFDTVARTLYFACSVSITNLGGAPVVLPDLQYNNGQFYLVVEEIELPELEWMMRSIQWFFNSQYNFLLNTANIQELGYEQSHSNWARGGERRERMGPTSVYGIGESALQTFTELQTLRHSANTMDTSANAFGTGTVSDIMPFHLGVQPPIRDHFPPIRFNILTNVKQML